jgi:hypothetical protein
MLNNGTTFFLQLVSFIQGGRCLRVCNVIVSGNISSSSTEDESFIQVKKKKKVQVLPDSPLSQAPPLQGKH